MRILSLCLSFFLIMSFCSCGARDERSTLDLLCEVLAYADESTGAAQIFSSEASEGELGYVRRELLLTMYGEKRVGECFESVNGGVAGDFGKIEEYALFISSRPIGEVAIFKCFSRSDTDLVARMCLERADAIKVALNFTELEKKSETIRVQIRGRYVLFVFADHPDEISEGFFKLV